MMQGKKNIWSNTLFLFFLGLMILPAFQAVFKPVDIEPLKGDVKNVERPMPSVKGWFDETLQQNTESWVNQKFGFRNTLVRLYNQVRFWLYKEAGARGVVVGKDNYLFEENYIKAYYGRDFIGDSVISHRVEILKKLQDTLSQMNKTLIVCFAPGKAQFYPEYIPEYLKSEKHRTNYETFLKEAKRQGLSYIDFNAWFLKMKGKAPYPLYPKTGIPWSQYGSELFLDSILNYIEAKQHVDLPEFVVKKRFLSDDYREPDRDIEEGMNMFTRIDNFPMGYSEYAFDAAGSEKIKIMVISDSFFWQLYNRGVMSEIFDDGQFWYYNSSIHQPSRQEGISVGAVDPAREILKKDVVLLLTTDANLPSFPWKFDELAYRSIMQNDSLSRAKREEKIRGYMEAIRESEEWLKQVQKKALERNIPLDSMIRLDAIYMVDVDQQ